MTILIKLGGSLITDKTKAKSFRRDSARRIASQLLRLRELCPDISLVIGHGSGSFGHFEARKYRTVAGVHSAEERLGFVKVGAVATELSQLVQNEFHAAGLPVMRFQPSSSLVARERRIVSFDSRALSMALATRMIPLIHGDVALDEAIGGTIISTEALFARLVTPLGAEKIILLGEVDGVLDQRNQVVPRVTPASFAQVRGALAGSHGVDVTGGMRQKVATMLDLARQRPALEVIIANGNRDDILIDLLARRRRIGTLIAADEHPGLPQS